MSKRRKAAAKPKGTRKANARRGVRREPRRGQQTFLAGTVHARVPRLHRLAGELEEMRMERRALGLRIEECETSILAELGKLGLERYRHDDLLLVRKIGSPRVEIKHVTPLPGELVQP